VTEFAETAVRRHYCRHQFCRSKLPAPVFNRREAFCKSGCHSSFYLHRCLVCEDPIQLPRKGVRLFCKKARCRNAWRAKIALGRYGIPIAKRTAKNADEMGTKTDAQSDRAWRIIAGPQLTPNQFAAATIPDGPECKWADGEYERIEAKNRAALREHFVAAEQAEIEANGYFTEPDWQEVISPDGVKCFVTRFRVQALPTPHATLPPIPDDLSIPDFLRRS
jgi:hypothetical protein